LASFGLRIKVSARWNLLLQPKDLPARWYSQFWKLRISGLRALKPVAENA
jgi:hypothetical protein